jgi:DNA-binding NtrC family response regulator
LGQGVREGARLSTADAWWLAAFKTGRWSRKEGFMTVPIAIVSAEPEHWEMLSGVVSRCGLDPVRCGTIAAATKLFAKEHFELAICADVLPDGTFRGLIAALRRSGYWTPVVVVSRSNDWGSYLEAKADGAYDYLAFPPYPRELERTVAAALTESPRNRRTEAGAAA